MIIGDWDFERLPKEKHNEVIEYVEMHQIGMLVAIHDEFRLSGFTAYCCHGNGAYVYQFYVLAIEREYIKRT